MAYPANSANVGEFGSKPASLTGTAPAVGLDLSGCRPTFGHAAKHPSVDHVESPGIPIAYQSPLACYIIRMSVLKQQNDGKGIEKEGQEAMWESRFQHVKHLRLAAHGAENYTETIERNAMSLKPNDEKSR